MFGVSVWHTENEHVEIVVLLTRLYACGCDSFDWFFFQCDDVDLSLKLVYFYVANKPPTFSLLNTS